MSDKVMVDRSVLELTAEVLEFAVMMLTGAASAQTAQALRHVQEALDSPAPALASAQGEQARGVLREGLSILLVSAQSAEAARLDQMHNHLDTGHPAAQTDGQAAQIHRLYVQAITQLLASAPAGAE